MLRGRFVSLNAYIRKEKTSKIGNLNVHLEKLQKEKQFNFLLKLKRKNKIISVLDGIIIYKGNPM